MRRFTDRTEAGRELAAMLHCFAHNPDVVVLGLSRGGVPVARVVAEELDVPLDVLVVRRLVLGGNDAYPIGAVAAGDQTTIDWRTADVLRISDTAIDALVARERDAMSRADRMYRSVKAPLDVAGSTVILVDDGLASGTTMSTAIATVRKEQPARVIVTAPIASRQAEEVIRRQADAAVFAYTPARMYDIDLWYEDFPPVSDAEVVRMLRSDAGRRVTTTRIAAHA